MKLGPFVLKILNGNKILTLINGHNSGTNVPKMMCNNPNLGLVNMNAYIKFGENLSICAQDIKRKQNLLKFCPFVLKILNGNEILA